MFYQTEFYFFFPCINIPYKINNFPFRGEFSVILEGVDKETNKNIVAKAIDVNSNTEKNVAQEFESFKSLKHQRIVNLLCAMRPAPNLTVFVMEQLEKIDILTYFASRKEFNEDMIVTALTQVRLIDAETC